MDNKEDNLTRRTNTIEPPDFISIFRIVCIFFFFWVCVCSEGNAITEIREQQKVQGNA